MYSLFMRMSHAFLSKRSRDMWSEVYNIKGHNQTLPCSDDDTKCDKKNVNVFMKNIINCTLVCHKDNIFDIKPQMNNDPKNNNSDNVITVADAEVMESFFCCVVREGCYIHHAV